MTSSIALRCVWLRFASFVVRFDVDSLRLGFVLLALLIAFRRFLGVLRENCGAMLHRFRDTCRGCQTCESIDGGLARLGIDDKDDNAHGIPRLLMADPVAFVVSQIDRLPTWQSLDAVLGPRRHRFALKLTLAGVSIYNR
jgi:hypothetical protein